MTPPVLAALVAMLAVDVYFIVRVGAYRPARDRAVPRRGRALADIVEGPAHPDGHPGLHQPAADGLRRGQARRWTRAAGLLHRTLWWVSAQAGLRTALRAAPVAGMGGPLAGAGAVGTGPAGRYAARAARPRPVPTHDRPAHPGRAGLPEGDPRPRRGRAGRLPQPDRRPPRGPRPVRHRHAQAARQGRVHRLRAGHRGAADATPASPKPAGSSAATAWSNCS